MKENKEVVEKYTSKHGFIYDNDAECILDFNDVLARVNELEKEKEKLKKDAKEAVNTTWRFIGAFKRENSVPVSLALKSAEYHLRQIDYIFE